MTRAHEHDDAEAGSVTRCHPTPMRGSARSATPDPDAAYARSTTRHHAAYAGSATPDTDAAYARRTTRHHAAYAGSATPDTDAAYARSAMPRTYHSSRPRRLLGGR